MIIDCDMNYKENKKIKTNACQKYLECQYPFKISLSCVTNGNPFLSSNNCELIAETFSYAEMHHFYVQVYSYLIHTTFFYRGGDFMARL